MSDSVASNRTSIYKQKKPVRRRNKRGLVVLFSLALLLLVGGVAGAIYWKIGKTLETVTSPRPNGVLPAGGLDSSYHADKPISLVILGRDTRPETGSMNTDVILVAVADPVTKKVTMVSLPRDTRVKIPGYRGYHKINEVYADGDAERRQAERNGQVPTEDGISLTKKTLKEMIGIPIDHYIEVDFDGFKAVIDELDGVEVNVDRKLAYDDPTDDTHIHLEPGAQLLNGEQALGYVRHRHDNRGSKYFSSDFDRNRRQQEVVKAIVDKTTSFEGLTKIFNILEVGAEHVHTDLSAEQIKGLAFDFKGLSSTSIITLENGGYWKSPYTYLPKENLYAIRSSLQSAMNLSGSEVSDINDSPIASAGDEETTVTKVTSPKPIKKKTSTESTSQVPQSSKPKTQSPPPPEQTQQPNQGYPETTPPPDIVAPPTEPQVEGEAPPDITNTPPPDIVAPPTAEQPATPEAQG